MKLIIDDIEYVLNIGSDLKRDGMLLEATIGYSKSENVIAEVFYSDISHKMVVSIFAESAPLELIERMISISKDRLVPVEICVGDLVIRFDDLVIDPHNISLSEDRQFLINIECHFAVHIDGSLFLDIPNFCIIEFVKQLDDWFYDDPAKNFHYLPIDSCETRVFELMHQDDAYYIKSCWENFPIARIISKAEVGLLLVQLKKTVIQKVRFKFGHQLTSYIDFKSDD